MQTALYSEKQPRPLDPIEPEFDRLAVVTIQGGGIYGLNLLGQLSYLTEQLNIVPVAVAGNSAGSIVATLYWAGYTPWQIRDIFVEMAENKKLVDLLGPFASQHKPFTLADFRTLKTEVVTTSKNLFGASNRSMLGRCIVKISSAMAAWGLGSRINSHFKVRGCFAGDDFVNVIDNLIREGPLLKDRIPNTGHLIEFGDVRKLIAKDPDINPPALFLTATNVTGRKLEAFNSIDAQYERVSIAKAVRASAGFPIFFRPVDFRDERFSGWYADGGIISNYPAWIFSKEFRLRLLESSDYRPVASRPWVHFGLRLENTPMEGEELDTCPFFYAKSLARLVLGGEARSELENRLENLVTRSITIQQPASKTGVPATMDLLDVDKITPDLVKEMYRLGKIAGENVGNLNYSLPKREIIEVILKQLVDRVLLVFGQHDNLTLSFRSNVFIPIQDTLRIRYSVYMNPPHADADADDPTANRDHDLQLRFDSGLTGFCTALRRPLICNLQEIAKQNHQLLDKLFGLSLDQHKNVRKDRTWLASVPIFDPFASFPRDITEPKLSPRPPHNAAFHYAVNGWTDGAVLGVINLDANLTYDQLAPPLDPDPASKAHNEDCRIVATLHMMGAVAAEIGYLLTQNLACPIHGSES